MRNLLLTFAPLLPPLPAVALVVEAFRARTVRGARAIIALGALTIVAGFVTFAVHVAGTIANVGDALPKERAAELAHGTSFGQSVAAVAIGVGVGLCAVGALIRALYRTPPAPSRANL